MNNTRLFYLCRAWVRERENYNLDPEHYDIWTFRLLEERIEQEIHRIEDYFKRNNRQVDPYEPLKD